MWYAIASCATILVVLAATWWLHRQALVAQSEGRRAQAEQAQAKVDALEVAVASNQNEEHVKDEVQAAKIGRVDVAGAVDFLLKSGPSRVRRDADSGGGAGA